MRGFIHFIRTQGVVGLAVGFIIGGAAQDLVKALSMDLISPTIGLASGKLGNLATASTTVYGQVFGWGHFIYSLVNLLLVALIVYFAVTRLNIETLDAKKEDKPL